MFYKIPKTVSSLLSAAVLCSVIAPVNATVFIGNLPEAVSDEDLNQLFSNYGVVRHASVSVDDTGKSKGFGFVDMANPSVEPDVIEKLNTTEFLGNIIKVNQASDYAKKAGGVNNRERASAIKSPDAPAVYGDSNYESPNYE